MTSYSSSNQLVLRWLETLDLHQSSCMHPHHLSISFHVWKECGGSAAMDEERRKRRSCGFERRRLLLESRETQFLEECDEVLGRTSQITQNHILINRSTIVRRLLFMTKTELPWTIFSRDWNPGHFAFLGYAIAQQGRPTTLVWHSQQLSWLLQSMFGNLSLASCFSNRKEHIKSLQLKTSGRV